MKELEPRIHDDSNGLDYLLVGDYYLPLLALPEENRPIGKWGRMHQLYLKEHHGGRYEALCLSCELWTYLADLNEQAQERYERIIDQMKATEGVTEDLKRKDWLRWVQAMSNIQQRAEEIILTELIYV